ncbi:MAG TPA: iron ABC transporter permease [Gammaproteobacteria bacterium]|nr:iron ABC transporter permease [Gammaproteobacteria bacterium]
MQYLAVFIALLVSLPVLIIVASLFTPFSDVWTHLLETVLWDYLSNTLRLVAGVSLGVLSIGVTTAWLVARYHFPGRALFAWALLLPLAMPAYIIAYTWTGVLDYAGPLQTGLRESFQWQNGDYWFPEIRSLGGAICMLSLVLYPYVYMLARIAFAELPPAAYEAARSLGAGSWRRFTRVALPLARPAIVTGLSLALMETVADYGTVQYFGVSTFTTGIFRVWFGMGESAAAMQLSTLLLMIVLTLILLERWSRREARHFQSGRRSMTHTPERLQGNWGWLAFFACLLPILLGFLLPALQLIQWSLETAEESLNAEFLTLALRSLSLAGTAALITVILAVVVGYARRLHPNIAVRTSAQIASLGYAIPGAVIAVGVILPFAWLDNQVDGMMRNYFGFSTGLLLSGSILALLFAYAVRFLAVSLQSVETGLARIKPSMDDAARSLGESPTGVLRRVHLPLLRGSLLAALLLVFVDVLKELPATLILRPFDFNTLAVRAYEMASDERLADAGLPALLIVAIGILPVIFISRISINRNHE